MRARVRGRGGRVEPFAVAEYVLLPCGVASPRCPTTRVHTARQRCRSDVRDANVHKREGWSETCRAAPRSTFAAVAAASSLCFDATRNVLLISSHPLPSPSQMSSLSLSLSLSLAPPPFSVLRSPSGSMHLHSPFSSFSSLSLDEPCVRLLL